MASGLHTEPAGEFKWFEPDPRQSGGTLPYLGEMDDQGFPITLRPGVQPRLAPLRVQGQGITSEEVPALHAQRREFAAVADAAPQTEATDVAAEPSDAVGPDQVELSEAIAVEDSADNGRVGIARRLGRLVDRRINHYKSVWNEKAGQAQAENPPRVPGRHEKGFVAERPHEEVSLDELLENSERPVAEDPAQDAPGLLRRTGERAKNGVSDAWLRVGVRYALARESAVDFFYDQTEPERAERRRAFVKAAAAAYAVWLTVKTGADVVASSSGQHVANVVGLPGHAGVSHMNGLHDQVAQHGYKPKAAGTIPAEATQHGHAGAGISGQEAQPVQPKHRIVELTPDDNPWRETSNAGEKVLGHPLSEPEKHALTDKVLDYNGLSWEDARHLPVGYRLKMPNDDTLKHWLSGADEPAKHAGQAVKHAATEAPHPSASGSVIAPAPERGAAAGLPNAVKDTVAAGTAVGVLATGYIASRQIVDARRSAGSQEAPTPDALPTDYLDAEQEQQLQAHLAGLELEQQARINLSSLMRGYLNGRFDRGLYDSLPEEAQEVADWWVGVINRGKKDTRRRAA